MKLLLVDFSGVWRMHWHASADQEVSAAYEKTVSRVRALAAEHDRTVICCDAPPYRRKELSPAYKSDREPPTQAMIEQGRRTVYRLEQDGHLIWRVKGFEADDVVASAVKWARDNATQTTIASSDKDLMQCVSDSHRITQYSFAADKTFAEADVIAKFGVHPKDMGDWLALVGDKSDGIAGVPGVGPKTAAKWLAEWGSLAGIFDNADQLEPKGLSLKFYEARDAVRLARKLVTLDDSLELPFGDVLKAAEVKPLNDAGAFPEEKEEEQDMTDDDAADMISGPPKSEPKNDSEPPPPPQDKAPPAVKLVATPKADTKSAPTETALATMAPVEWSMQLEPRASAGAWWLAQKLEDSRMYPQFGNAAGIYAMLLRGRALGLDATTALASFHNIKGKIAMHADLIEALVLRSGKAEYFDCIETTSKKAVYETKRKGSRNKLRIEFTIEDAWQADLVTKDQRGQDGFRGVGDKGPSNWDKYRSTMLRHRCKTQLARAVYADVVLGLYMPEELGGEGVIDAEYEVA